MWHNSANGAQVAEEDNMHDLDLWQKVTGLSEGQIPLQN